MSAIISVGFENVIHVVKPKFRDKISSWRLWDFVITY
jgi:hypothetical protein